MNKWLGVVLSAALLFVGGCVSIEPPLDYTAYRASNPKSILVLPPVNHSSEVIAPYAVLSHVTKPLAEAGYYVFPVALVDQTFKHNGLTVAEDIHQIAYQKLHEIYDADTAMYLTINQYGTSYMVLGSDTVVTVSAQLIDLRNGQLLWQGQARAASSEEQENHNQHGIIGMLVDAALTQVFETLADKGFDVAETATNRLFQVGTAGGLLPGPRSPQYGVQPTN
jgi:hypothetical protein